MSKKKEVITFTEREQQVMKLLDSCTVEQIAEVLGISTESIEVYILRIEGKQAKLGWKIM